MRSKLSPACECSTCKPEPEFELECIRCMEVVHSDTMDEDGRCGDCQEWRHKRQEMYR